MSAFEEGLNGSAGDEGDVQLTKKTTPPGPNRLVCLERSAR